MTNYHLDVVVSWEGALAADRVDLRSGHDHVELEPALVEGSWLLPFVVLLHENEVNIAGLSHFRIAGQVAIPWMCTPRVSLELVINNKTLAPPPVVELLNLCWETEPKMLEMAHI